MVYLYNILFLIGSVGLFILATKIISEGLTNLASGRLRKMFSKLSNKPLTNVGIGAATAAITESSAATTVMTIGLVNASVISLLQATFIIMGANIGTTINAQIAALQTFHFTDFFLLFIFVGVLMDIVAKKDLVKKIGKSLMGFGLIFLAIKCMSLAVANLKDSEVFIDILTGVKNPVLLILVGMVLTAIIQSSAATTGILLAIVANGLVIGGGGNSILFVVLGTNIGTCITALIASLSSNANGKRAALIHLMFNVFGALLFFIVLMIYKNCYTDLLKVFSKSTTSLAMFHTFFNVICTLLFIPIAKLFVKLATALVKDKKDKPHTTYIDELQLKNPSIALEMTIKEIIRLKNKSYEAVTLAVEDFASRSNKNLSSIEAIKEEISKANYEVTGFLIKLSATKLAKPERIRVSSFYHVVSDIDRIVDLAYGVEKCNDNNVINDVKYSEAAHKDVNSLVEALNSIQELSTLAFENKDKKALKQVEEVENQVDALRKASVDNHIERIKNNECDLTHGATFERIVNDLERIGDHLTFIGRSIIEVAHTN